MARIDELVELVSDEGLRQELRSAVAEFRETKTFGLVFERHIPEGIGIPLPIRAGAKIRHKLGSDPLFVDEVRETTLVATDPKTDTQSEVPRSDYLVLRDFGEPIYPALRSVGGVAGVSSDRPVNAIINAENYHALQLLAYLYRGAVDCIYIDPPYNTGDRTWTYNNRFVDENDSNPHSKWLAFMERRLNLARKLLKPNGVLVVTTDEHEVLHLGMLLESLFKDAYRQMVTIVTNPKGVTRDRFSRVEEYALFVFFGTAGVSSRPDDLLTWGADEAGEGGEAPRWKGLLRSGSDALPSDRPNMVYPIAVDRDTGRIAGAGETLKEKHERGLVSRAEYDSWKPDLDLEIDGNPVAWPIRNKGQLGRWSIGRETLLDLAEKGMAKVGSFNKKRRTFALSYLSDKLQAQVESGFLEIVDRDPETGVLDVRYIDEKDRRIKTVWHRSSHDAGAGGSDLLEELIGERRFDYPKSVYSVADTLGSIVGDNPDALILDFFAGSGTTLHATWLLNAEDDGRRRCVLVTNNEVTAKTQERLKDAGHLPGDEAWEAEGVFQAVTTKRVTAAISGATEDGVKLDGDYRGGRLRELGFPERVEYFDLTYMDPDLVDLGESFSAIHPCLWLMAGGIGELPSPVDPSHPYLIREDSNYAVLFDEDKFAEFVPLIGAHEAISHVWLVTDEESIFASMAERLPVGVESAMLYSSYLENFRIGAGGVG